MVHGPGLVVQVECFSGRYFTMVGLTHWSELQNELNKYVYQQQGPKLLMGIKGLTQKGSVEGELMDQPDE